MDLEFEWNPDKAISNLKKHGVSFSEAASVLGDPLSVTVADPAHSDAEDRWITVGRSASGRVLMVSHADRGMVTRIISARRLTRAEQDAHGTGSFD